MKNPDLMEGSISEIQGLRQNCFCVYAPSHEDV
jgi:hypothetical protein